MDNLKDSMIKMITKYEVGALLYSPANSMKIVKTICEQRIEPPYSVALCLEDAITDNAVEEAENILKKILSVLYRYKNDPDIYIPKIFVRVREPQQINMVYYNTGIYGKLIEGFIIPKYSIENADKYNDIIAHINTESDRVIYMMPILESADIIFSTEREKILSEIKGKIDTVKGYVLNIRTGGNDFCNCFGLRRSVTQTIYDIGVVRDCLIDILKIMSADYVVSAPVWEYFDTGIDDKWKKGLERELRLDRLNGFIGKTAIHPSQVKSIIRSLKVSSDDYDDAIQILNWKNDLLGVAKGKGRMNEVKCHIKWAENILCLAKIYGIRGKNNE